MRFDRQKFIDDLRYLATLNCRWRRNGTSIATGLDCIGVLRWAYERQGLLLPQPIIDEWSYGLKPDGIKMIRIMREWFEEIELEAVQPADLLVTRIRHETSHVIAKISEQEIAEAYQSREGSVSKFLIRPFPGYRIAACFRIPDFTEV